MQDLTALREFQIQKCPKLSRKCREEVRHKIAHVPNIDFDEYFNEDSGSSSWRDDDFSIYLPGEDDEVSIYVFLFFLYYYRLYLYSLY